MALLHNPCSMFFFHQFFHHPIYRTLLKQELLWNYIKKHLKFPSPIPLSSTLPSYLLFIIHIFFDSSKSLLFLFFDPPGLLPHSEVVIWVTQGMPMSTVRIGDRLKGTLWYELVVKSDLWLPSSKTAWIHITCSACMAWRHPYTHIFWEILYLW